MKSALLLACLIFLAIHTFAQNKPVALKFDEFDNSEQLSYSEMERMVKAKIERFVTQLKLERSKQVYIIQYRERIQENSRRHSLSNWVGSAESAVPENFKSEDVFVVDGGIRKFDTIEFWIAPKNAPAPKPTPTFKTSEAIDCPSIYANQSSITFDKSKPVNFKASLHPDRGESYNWSVTDGTIIGENGRPLLEVDVSGVKADRITAFLEVSGIPRPCKNKTHAVAEFGNMPRLIEEFNRVSNGEFRALADSFLITLQNHPEKQGYAYIYGGRQKGSRDAEARKRLLSNHIRFRGFDEARIKIIDAGYREELSTEFWLVPPGAKVPTPKPTVDARFINVPRRPRPSPRKR